MLKKINRFCEEPFRIFFPLALGLGAIGAGHWLFYALGWTKGYSGLFHAAIQTRGYLGCFVIGFLMTAMPRFASAPPATKSEVAYFLLLTAAILSFQAAGKLIVAELCFIFWLLGIGRFALSRVGRAKKGKEKISPPVEFVWIPIGLLHGLSGALLLILNAGNLAPTWALPVGRALTEQGFLLSVVVGVGGFLAPRLMGRFRILKPSEVCSVEAAKQARRRQVFFHLGLGLLLYLSFWLEGFASPVWSYGLRSLVVSIELLWTCSLFRLPQAEELYAKFLWISLWMVVVGYWAVVIFPALRKEMLHLVFIGGFSLMAFAVGTVVVLSHAGEPARLKGPLPALWGVAFALALALIFRISSAFVPNRYFAFLGAAGAAWLVAGSVWLAFILPNVLKIPCGEEFEQFHEAAKEKLKGHE